MFQESGIGSHHENAVAFQAFPLRVEQVGDAVQRHNGFAGSGTTLDHHDAGVVQPDDLVLLGLDGGDDIAHLLAARCVHRGEQGRVTVLVVTGAPQHLVGEVDQSAPARVELAPPAHVLRMRGGRCVERPRGRGAPIEQQRFEFVVLVEDSDPPDVGTFARQCVQPAEAQPVVGDVQPPHLPRRSPHFDVAIHQRAAVTAQRRAIPVLRPRAFRVEPAVQPSQIVLFGT